MVRKSRPSDWAAWACPTYTVPPTKARVSPPFIAALEAGIDLLDTGDFYGMGHNEMLVRKGIGGRRDKVFIAVKFGALRGPDNSFNGLDMRPVAVKNFVAYSLRRLGTDYIDLYQPCRVDANIPIEDTIGAIADLVSAGYVRHIGISEASANSLRRAYAT
jgi:aryl-alcohol dehydrogenase-like predicted oxidoreductase